MNNNRTKALRSLILASVLTAVITVMTFFIKIPSHQGYIHLGDSIIYLAACLLPTPLAVISAALGGMFADAFGGFIIYIIPTFIIKGLLALVFSNKKSKILCKRNIIALVPATLVTTVGYYIAEVILLSMASATGFKQIINYFLTSAPWVAAVYSIPPSLVQAVGSAIAFILIAAALDKIKIKDRIN